MKKRLKILVAEDEEQVRNVLKATLNTQDYEIFLAGDGMEAVDLFTQYCADAIIMDLLMPRMDGYQAIQTIRQMKTGTEIPIIVLTALDSPEWEQKAMQAGASQFLTKPFRGKELLHCLRTTLEQGKKRKSSKVAKPARDISLNVRYQTNQGFLNCYVKNLMDGVSFLQTDKVLPLGSTFYIEITPPKREKSFRVRAVVKWINLYAENKGMGVHFTFENPKDERRIQDLVNQLK